jgi:hypothetical protein
MVQLAAFCACRGAAARAKGEEGALACRACGASLCLSGAALLAVWAHLEQLPQGP